MEEHNKEHNMDNDSFPTRDEVIRQMKDLIAESARLRQSMNDMQAHQKRVHCLIIDAYVDIMGIR